MADLRDKGVLTQKEFDRKKKVLLNSGKAGPSSLMTFAAGLVSLIIIGSFVTKAIEKGSALGAPSLGGSACEIPEVQSSVLEYITENNKMRFAAKIHDQVTPRSLADISEVYVNSGSGFTACVAKVLYSGHEGTLGYTVTWVDRSRGEFSLEFSSMNAVLAEYRDVR